MKPTNRYLGDGVYAEFDDFQIWLKTQEGNEIALEPETFNTLLDYARDINRYAESLTGRKYFHGI